MYFRLFSHIVLFLKWLHQKKVVKTRKYNYGYAYEFSRAWQIVLQNDSHWDWAVTKFRGLCCNKRSDSLGYVGFYLPPAGFSLMLELLPPPPPGGGRSQSADFGRCILRLLRKSIALDNMRNGLRRSEIEHFIHKQDFENCICELNFEQLVHSWQFRQFWYFRI